MNTKKIIIGLVGGAVAGYFYYQFIAKKKVVKTVAQGVEEVVEEGEGELKSIGGGGGGGGFIPTTDTGSTATTETGSTATTETGSTATTETGATTNQNTGITPKPAVQPIKEPIVSVKPLVYPKPAPTTSIKEAYTKELASISKFSGIGGDRWEADIDNLDI